MFCDDRSCQFLISYCFLWSKLYSLTKGDFMIYVSPVTRDVLTCHAGVGEGQNNVLSWNQYLTTEMNRKWKVSAIRHLKTRNRSKVNSLYPPQKKLQKWSVTTGSFTHLTPAAWSLTIFSVFFKQDTDCWPWTCFMFCDDRSCQFLISYSFLVSNLKSMTKHNYPPPSGTARATPLARHARRVRTSRAKDAWCRLPYINIFMPPSVPLFLARIVRNTCAALFLAPIMFRWQETEGHRVPRPSCGQCHRTNVQYIISRAVS